MSGEEKVKRKLQPIEVSIIKKVVVILAESDMTYQQALELIPEIEKYLKLHSMHQLIKTGDRP